MLMSEVFPSKYLKAADLKDRQHTLIMDRVTLEIVGEDQKPILYFQNREKGLLLNKTNNNAISFIYGDESDDWKGHEVIIYATTTDFPRPQTPCIRVRVPLPKDRLREVRTNGHPPRPAPTTIRPELDDEIPF